jgi:hypothetical protein
VSWALDYATPEELKSYLRIGDNADDVFVALWVATVSRNIDDHCGRQFGQVDALEERVYTPHYNRFDRAYTVEIDDVQDVTGLTVTAADGTEVAAADYTLLPRNAPQKGKPYERIQFATDPGEITISALWGWTAVPSAVKVGLLLQGARLAARRDSPFGIAGSPSEGSEIRLLAQLDPDFRTSLRPFTRDWWAA